LQHLALFSKEHAYPAEAAGVIKAGEAIAGKERLATTRCNIPHTTPSRGEQTRGVF